MKDLRDLKDLTIHDVQPISDEQTTGETYRKILHSISRPGSATFVGLTPHTGERQHGCSQRSQHLKRKIF